MHTLDDVFAERTGRGLSDLLLLLFDAGVCYGLGQPWEGPASNTACVMVETIKARWHAEQNAIREWTHERTMPSDIPAWLRTAIEQHGQQHPPQERVAAFGPQPLPTPDWLDQLADESREREALAVGGET